MDRVYDNATKLLEKEIEEINSKGELTPSSLDVMYKVTDIIKDIETICAMRESEEYSGRYMYDDDMSYARGRGRNARRDSMGRYARESYGRSYDGYGENSYARGRYSRDEEDLEQMMRGAKTEKERDLIRQLMEVKQHN